MFLYFTFFFENEIKFYIHRHVASRYIKARKSFMQLVSNISNSNLSFYKLRDHKKVNITL